MIYIIAFHRSLLLRLLKRCCRCHVHACSIHTAAYAAAVCLCPLHPQASLDSTRSAFRIKPGAWSLPRRGCVNGVCNLFSQRRNGYPAALTGGDRDAGCLPRRAPTILRVPRGDVPTAFCAAACPAAPTGGLAPLAAGDCAGEDPEGLATRLKGSPSTAPLALPIRGGGSSAPVAPDGKLRGSSAPAAPDGKLRGSGVPGAAPDVPGLPKRPAGLAKLLLSPVRPGVRPGGRLGPRPPYLLPMRPLPYVSALGPYPAPLQAVQIAVKHCPRSV